jgi:ATP-binding cassette subfamily C protein CydC
VSRGLRRFRAAVAGDPLTRVLAAMRPDAPRTALAVLCGTAATGAAVGLMGTSGWLISRAAQQPPVLYLMVAVVTVRALGLGRGILRYCERLASHDVALRGVVNLRVGLYERLAAADPAAAAGLRRGDLLARVGADADAVADVVARAVLPALVSLASSVAAVAAVAVVLPPAGAVLAAGLLVSGVVAPLLAGVAAGRAERDGARTRAAIGAEVHTLLEGLPELTVAGAVPACRERLRALDAERARELDRAARPAAVAAFLATTSAGAAVLGCLLLGAQAVRAGDLSPVMLAVVTLVPLAAAEITVTLPAAAVTLVRARVAAGRLTELLGAPPATERDPLPAPAELLARVRGLACGWPGREPVLTGVDLDLRRGDRVAVVGPTGAGKTTLLQELARRVPGAVHTAEDAHVFATTVRENLRLADPGAPDEALVAALRAVGLDGWLAGLPASLDTVLGNALGSGSGQRSDAGGGVPLSGGERRRLLLARAVLAPGDLVLLDEPAEHLDPDAADALVAAALGPGLFGDRAVVLVTHRLSALEAAREVLVVADGRIAARGTHAALLGPADGVGDRTYRRAWLAEQPTTDATP